MKPCGVQRFDQLFHRLPHCAAPTSEIRGRRVYLWAIGRATAVPTLTVRHYGDLKGLACACERAAVTTVLHNHALKSMQAFKRCTLILTATRLATKSARTCEACSEVDGRAKYAKSCSAAE